MVTLSARLSRRPLGEDAPALHPRLVRLVRVWLPQQRLVQGTGSLVAARVGDAFGRTIALGNGEPPGLDLGRDLAVHREAQGHRHDEVEVGPWRRPQRAPDVP